MNFEHIEPKQMGNYDVIVVGGGIAGIAAAVSSARNGLKTMLIEKQFNLGGLATVGLISWYEPLCDGKGQQMIFGIAEELIKLSYKHGFDSLDPKWGGTERSFTRRDRYATRYSPTIFALLLDEYVMENGVELLLDTYGTYPVMEGNICKGVITENTDGRCFYGAKVVIDATGDAAIMARAGVPCVYGKNYLTYVVHAFDKEGIDEFHETGNMWKFRDWWNSGSDMNGNGHPEGKPPYVADSAKVVMEFIEDGKMRMLNKIKSKDRYSYDLMMVPTMPQFRTIRRIIGDTDFTAEDGKLYEDSIGWCGDFRPKGIGNHYQIPRSALYNSNFPNLLAAGRIISAPEGDGWEVARVIPTCALTGEAAGNTAKMWIDSGRVK